MKRKVRNGKPGRRPNFAGSQLVQKEGNAQTGRDESANDWKGGKFKTSATLRKRNLTDHGLKGGGGRGEKSHLDRFGKGGCAGDLGERAQEKERLKQEDKKGRNRGRLVLFRELNTRTVLRESVKRPWSVEGQVAAEVGSSMRGRTEKDRSRRKEKKEALSAH